MGAVKRKAKGSRRYGRLSTYKYNRELTKMPKQSKSYKKIMAKLINKKKNTTVANKDRDNIKKNVGGGNSKKVEQI